MGPKQFLGLADQLPEALLLLSREGEILAANRAAGELLDSPAAALPGQSLADLVENAAEEVHRHLRFWSRSTQPVPAPLTWRSRADSGVERRCYGFVLRSGQGGGKNSAGIVVRCEAGTSPASTFVALNRELDKQRRALRRLKESRQALAVEHEKAVVTLSSIGDAVVTTDREGYVDYLNPIAEALTGWRSDEAKGRPLREVFHIINEYTREAAPDPVSRCLDEGRIVGLANHTALIARDGLEYVIEDSAAPIRTPDQRLYGAVLVFRDVTEDRLAQRQLEYLAQHDTLTGLANRHHFEQQLEQAVASCRRGDKQHAMLYLDLDEFKMINDTAGHSVGDALLADIGQMFARRSREGDVLARLGGDEFALLLYDINDLDAAKTAEAYVYLVDEFRAEHAPSGYRLGASIGVAMIGEDTVSPAEIMKKADIACYVAKRQGGGRVHVYSDQAEDSLATIGEMNLVGRIKQALEAERFALEFQPIVRLPDKQEALCEALVRMVDEDDTLIAPGFFLPTAKSYGLLPSLDRLVVKQALGLLKRYHARGKTLALSVNLSGASLGDGELLETIKQALGPEGMLPGGLVFEITETEAVAHMKRAHDFMRELKALGCQFALDDFGIGFSSFAYLKHLPVDYLKIDGTFVRDLVNDPVDQEVVRSITQVAHSLGKTTIAEFVESAEILGQLQAFGVDMAQGFHIARPGPLNGDD